MEFDEAPAWLRNILSDLEAKGKGTGGFSLGDRWRIIEGPYPTPSSAHCVQLQFRDGTMWSTKWAIKPDGTPA